MMRRLRPRNRPATERTRRACLALFGAAALLLSAPPSALADISVEEEGRQSRTRPKQPQRVYDGLVLDLYPSAVPPRPSGRTLDERGRGLLSEPQSPVSVGIIGCPGCTEALRALGGVVVDGRSAWRPRGRP